MSHSVGTEKGNSKLFGRDDGDPGLKLDGNVNPIFENEEVPLATLANQAITIIENFNTSPNRMPYRELGMHWDVIITNLRIIFRCPTCMNFLGTKTSTKPGKATIGYVSYSDLLGISLVREGETMLVLDAYYTSGFSTSDNNVYYFYPTEEEFNELGTALVNGWVSSFGEGVEAGTREQADAFLAHAWERMELNPESEHNSLLLNGVGALVYKDM